MKNRLPVFTGLLSSWVFMSVLVHAGVGGSFYYWFVMRKPAGIVADLDLSMSPLKPNIEKHRVKHAPPPVKSAVVETKQKAEKTEEQSVAPACPEPCPQTTVSVAPSNVGGDDGEGSYISADQATRKPRWIKNFITPRDYPMVARQNGKDGRVLLTVLIDATGAVRDVRLLQGSYDALNEVALRKVKEALFSPAYDASGKPVSCKVTLPIRFELR
jgi:protein TonB